MVVPVRDEEIAVGRHGDVGRILKKCLGRRASVAAVPGLERLAGNGGDDPARVVDAADRMVVGGVGDVEVVVGVERDALNSADVGVGR